MPKLNIVLGALVDGGRGQVSIETSQPLYCPQCATPVLDGGQCLVRFEAVPNHSLVPELALRAPLLVALMCDCRTCGYYGPGPATVFISPTDDSETLKRVESNTGLPAGYEVKAWSPE